MPLSKTTKSLKSLDIDWPAYFDLLAEQEGRRDRAMPGWELRVWTDPLRDSYQLEVDRAATLFDDHTRFEDMSKKGRQTVGGIWLSDGSASTGYLGNNGASGLWKSTVNKAPAAVGRYLDRMPSDRDLPVSRALLDDVFSGLLDVRGVGIGVATGLLARKRPDLFCTVNNACREGLRLVFEDVPNNGISQRNITRYLDLIDEIHALKWWRSKPPKSERELWTWRNRVALIDAVFYDPSTRR